MPHDGSDNSPPTTRTVQPGDELGVYTLLEPIGAGGMGQVFRARHRLMNRVVALKVIRPELLTDPTAEARFRNEMQLAAQLTHPNIVTVYDAQRDGDQYFLVMEFCDGPSLRQIVRTHGPLPQGLACELARQVASGLEHAHKRGLVHRDIKPDNLLLVGTTIKILDFGLARAMTTADGPLKASRPFACGTPDFIAPEQATNPEDGDGRTDLYSLGATLYFALTGEPPFPGGNAAEKILRHRLEPPFPLAERRPELADAVCAIVSQLLQKDPARRQPSAGDLAAQLEGLALPVESHNWDFSLVDGGPPQSNEEALATVAAPSLPVAISAEWHSTPFPIRRAAGPDATSRRPGFRRRALIVSSLVCTVAVAAWHFARDRADPASPQVASTAPAAASASPTMVIAPDDWTLEHTFRSLPSHPFSLAFSADSRLLAVACARFPKSDIPGGLRIWEIPSFREHVTFADQQDFCAVAFSPDGRTFVSTSWNFDTLQGDVTLWDMSTWQPRQKFADHPIVNSLSFNHDGTRLAIAGTTNSPELWDLSGPTAMLIGALPPQENVVDRLAFSADGTLLASSGRNLPIQLWSADTLELLRTVSQEPLRAAKSAWVGWSPDGTRLVAVTNNWPEHVSSEIHIWDLSRDVVLRRDRQFRNFARCLFTPNGEAVVTADAESLVCWPVDSSRASQVIEGPTGDWIVGLAISPDGAWLAAGRSSDDTVALYRLRP